MTSGVSRFRRYECQKFQVRGVRFKEHVEHVAEQRDRADGDVEQNVAHHSGRDCPGYAVDA